MTSVLKPLKFLRPHYGTLKEYFERMPESDLKESLKYRLLGSEGDIGLWGHEYVRNLAGEIAQEFQKRQFDDMPIDALMDLVQQIVAFHMKPRMVMTVDENLKPLTVPVRVGQAIWCPFS